MHWLTRVLVVMAVVASAASHAESTKPLDANALDAAEKLWVHAPLQSYAFRFQYVEFASPCGSWAFDVRVSHRVPEHRSDCRPYRTEFSTVPLLFTYLRHALMPSEKTTTSLRQTSIQRWVTPSRSSLRGLRQPTISLALKSSISRARSRHRVDFDDIRILPRGDRFGWQRVRPAQ